MLEQTHLDQRAMFSRPLPPPSPGATDAALADDLWARLERFLHSAADRELVIDDLEVVGRCLAEDRFRTLRRIVDTSASGLVPKNDPAIFSLALAAKLGDATTRRAAYAALPEVCRDGAQLLRFVEYARRFGGWGRGMRSAVGAWFTARPASELARELVMHPAIPGWSMRDVLRLAHPRAPTPSHDRLFAWVVNGKLPGDAATDPACALIVAIEQLRRTRDVAAAARIIRTHHVPRAWVPNALQDEPAIDAALVD